MRYRTLTLVAAIAAVAAVLVSAGCAGSSETVEPAADEPVPVAPVIDSTARDEVGPPPVTEAERTWLQALERYKARYERAWGRSITITHASMRQLASVYGDCAKTLRKAGDPGRYAPAALIAERACSRLTRAEELLETAISASDSGGRVVVGTPEEKVFDRALDGSFEAAGNARNGLERALEKAERLTGQIEKTASIPRGTRVA